MVRVRGRGVPEVVLGKFVVGIVGSVRNWWWGVSGRCGRGHSKDRSGAAAVAVREIGIT